MVDIALYFVGFALLILFLLLGAAVYFIPRVLSDEDHEETSEESHGPPGSHAN
ncbi:MAG: hypothetical protein V5A43_11195 [Haloarculaceae archaeon]